jgi:hypothetical protein
MISCSFDLQGLVDAFDRLVGELLNVVVHSLLFVLADGAVFLGALQLVVGVAADVADGDLLLLGVLAGELGQLAPALLGQRRDRDADGCAVGDRIQAQARGPDGLFDGPTMPLS